jgi:extracellular elastinolytic metalloproteinase
MIRCLLIPVFAFVTADLFAQPSLPDLPALLAQHKNAFGLTADDIAEFAISSAYTTEHLHITHVYLEQRYLDIPVYTGILNLNLAGDNLVSFGNRWITDLKSKAPSPTPDISAQSAVQRSAANLGYNYPDAVEVSKKKNKLGQYTKVIFEPGSLAHDSIVTELVWLQRNEKEVLLCWKVEIAEINNENVWDILIDAHTGAYIKKDNQTQHCSFPLPTGNFEKQDQNFQNNQNFQNKNQNLQDYRIVNPVMPESPVMVTPDSSYNVFPMPIESPNHGPRSIVTRPWTNAGSGNHAITLGWHNNGTTNYTTTRGNNVYAYEDINHDNNPGYSPDTFNLRFDYPFTPALDPTVNLASCITNLFYWNNLMHDVTYQYGFDEVSGNFQNNNLSRGGVGADYVKAEAQDGSGTNNANFSTPADGSSGRMQMYVWSPVGATSPLTINSPASIAGSMWSVESAFSTNNKLINTGAKTGNLLLVNDTGGSTHLGCGALSNGASLPGKIAVIDRGTCDFVTKVKNVQTLGAIAAIIIDNVTEDPFAMSGTDNTITIPAVMISLANGNALKAVMTGNTVNATLAPVPQITPDGDFDSGVICHEYGHGVSTRLTGGPLNVNCLNNAEQMGEGWSDFFGLMLTTNWTTASANDSRGIGTYVLGEPPTGLGIRTYPYTTNIAVNPHTYADVATTGGEVHQIGEIWATMLWEMVWSIMNVTPPSTDIYHGTGGNNVAMQLVMDGMKLQPCSPGFVDGRDAILLADQLDYGGQYHCAIWNAFAKRGLGKSASQGSSNSYTDGVAAYDVPSGVSIKSIGNPEPAGEGQEVTFSLKTTCQCAGKSNFDVKDVLSSDLTYIPGSGGTLVGNTVSFTKDTLAPLDSVTYSYHAYVNPCSATAINTLNTENAESTAQYVSIKLSGSGTKVWSKVTSLAVSPTHSWNGPDYTSAADYVLKLINPVTTTSGPVEIGFYHRYNTEATWDGGVVEYSINGGTTWLDAGAYFTEHGYPSAINGASGTGIAGRAAFTGSSDTQFGSSTFIHSTIRLVLGGPQSLLIRFRMVCDANTGVTGINGWFIDDIVIKQLSGLTNKTKVVDNGQGLDSIYYALQTTVFSSTKIYVDANANGNKNGTSWVNAMRYLPNAISIAGCRTADSVLVAKGTYLPSLSNTRTQSFNIPDNTYLFGGFPTGGGTFAQRNFVTNVSLLSGDIGTVNNNADNSYHVVKIDSARQNTILDGFTISNGNANGTGDNSVGAAVFCLGNLTMNQVTVNNCVSLSDGELLRIRSAAGNLKVKDCTLHGSNDNKVQILNTNGATFTAQGSTQVYKQ